MASTSSRSSARIRDKDKAVRGGGAGRDVTDPGRTPRSSRCKQEPPQIIFNISGDIQITKGTMFGHSPEEEYKQLQRSHPNVSPLSSASLQPLRDREAPRVKKPHRIIAAEDDEAEESQEIESDRGFSCDDEPSTATPVSAQRVQAWKDSAYSGSTRGPKRDKNEVYRASLSRGSSDEFSAEDGSSRTKRAKKPPSAKSKVEGGASSEYNEATLTTQGDDEGGNGDDSDDDFETRLMNVATSNNKNIEVRVTLDTGTKPDWISSLFLTDTLGLKCTRLIDEKDKQEFRDFNGNKFSAVGKADVMVNSTDFSGFQFRKISFLVAKGGNFKILLGSRTIRKEKLLCKPPEPEREGAFPAVQTDVKKAERAIIAQRKETQEKEGTNRDKLREETRKAKTKEKKESKWSSSSAVRFAQESKPERRRERSTSPPPSRNTKHPISQSSKSSWKKTKAPLHERSSSSSLSGGGAAIGD